MAQQRDESFFSRLTRLFRSGPAIRRKIKGYDDTGYYDKQAALASKNNFGALPFRRGAASNSPFNMLGGSDLMSRTTRYMEFAEMEYTPIIARAIDIQADEICSGDENGKNFHVYSDNPRIKETLEELFYDILNVDFNLRVWARNLIKYGDFFLYKEVAPGVGVVNAIAMNVNEVERDEGYDPNDPYAVRFKWHKMGMKELENWQVSHFRILGNDRFNPYGTSILESARRIWRQYIMMLDAMLIYRLVRSPERRVFYVDVGNMAANDIPNHVQTVMATIRGNMAVDKETGRMDERFNSTDVLEDYVIPVRGANSGTKIDTLSGGTHQTATEDIQIIESQLFSALGVPKAYLGYDEMLSSKATLAQEDIRFSRSIQIIQKIIIAELNNIAILHLYAKGFDGEDLIDFDLRLSNPSSVALQQKLDLWKSKIDIIAAVDQIETKFLPMEWLYKEIMKFTDGEIANLRDKLKKDKEFAVELEAITSPRPSGENTVDPFDSTSYQQLGGTQMTPPVPNLPSSPINPIQSNNNAETILSYPESGVPVKVNPQVRKDRRNYSRRESELSMLAQQPAFSKMLNPTKNTSLADVYDSEFLDNPLREELRQNLIGTTKNSYLSKQMISILDHFDKKTKLPVEVEIISEAKDPIDESLESLIVVQGDYPEELGEPKLQDLLSLGLDIKKPEDDINKTNDSDQLTDNILFSRD